MQRKPASGKKAVEAGQGCLRRRSPGAGWGSVARDGTVASWNPAWKPAGLPGS